MGQVSDSNECQPGRFGCTDDGLEQDRNGAPSTMLVRLRTATNRIEQGRSVRLELRSLVQVQPLSCAAFVPIVRTCWRYHMATATVTARTPARMPTVRANASLSCAVVEAADSSVVGATVAVADGEPSVALVNGAAVDARRVVLSGRQSATDGPTQPATHATSHASQSRVVELA